MRYNFIIGIDPSGAYWEGKGTTGYSVFHAPDNRFIELGTIQAAGQVCAEAYWDKHIKLLERIIFSQRGKKKSKASKTIVVIEDYFLYAEKAESQINSRMETSKLIGILQHWCYTHDIPYCMQPAGLVKKRWTDDIMHHKGHLKQKGMRYEESVHTRDSMRHVLHFATFRNGDEKNGE